MKPNKFILSILLFISCTYFAYSQPVDNVNAYYPFSGNTNDVTVNAKNATGLNVTLAADRLGNANSAYYFNGTTAMMYLPNTVLSSNSAFAVSVWFKTSGDKLVSDGNYNQVIIDFRGQYQIFLCVLESKHPTNPGVILFNLANTTASISCMTSNNFVQKDTWYHVVGTYSNNTIQLYVNDNLLSTQSQTPPSIISGYNNTIGKDYHGSSDNRLWFFGSIDEVLIYNRGLTSTEVQQIYTRGLNYNDIPELYNGTTTYKFTYDLSGNLTDRNIVLSSSALKSVKADSTSYDKSSSPQVFEENVNSTQKVVIYPNPTRGQLKVEIEGFTETTRASVYLYSLSGELLISKSPASGSSSLDLSVFSLGTYILKVKIDDKISEWKVIKQ
jgi:hypothetical protein